MNAFLKRYGAALAVVFGTLALVPAVQAEPFLYVPTGVGFGNDGGFLVYDAASDVQIGGTGIAGSRGSIVGGVAAPDGSKVYLLDQAHDRVVVVDTSTGRVIGPPIDIAVQAQPPVISPYGNRLYLAFSFPTAGLVAIDTTTRAVTTIQLPGAFPAVTVSRDGSKLYVADFAAGLIVMSVATNTPILGPIRIRNNAVSGAPAVTADGRLAYIPSADGFVDVFNFDTNTVGTPIALGGAPQQVLLSPDEQKLYVLSEDSSDFTSIKVVSTATRSVLATIPLSQFAETGVLTPDGSKLYVDALTNGRTGLWVVDTATNSPSFIAISAGPTAPFLSPSGPAVVPTLDPWALLSMALVLAGGGVMVLRRTRPT